MFSKKGTWSGKMHALLELGKPGAYEKRDMGLTLKTKKLVFFFM